MLFYIVWELHTYILLQFCNEKEYPPITPAIVEVNWKKGPVQSIRTNWKNDNEGICIYSVWPFLLFGLAIPWFGPAEHINVHLHEDKGAIVDKSWKAGPWPATVVFGFIPSGLWCGWEEKDYNPYEGFYRFGRQNRRWPHNVHKEFIPGFLYSPSARINKLATRHGPCRTLWLEWTGQRNLIKFV